MPVNSVIGICTIGYSLFYEKTMKYMDLDFVYGVLANLALAACQVLVRVR